VTSDEIKKELKNILDNYIADNLPVDKKRLDVELRQLIMDIIEDEKEFK
jgi:hypothetical protein